MNTENAKRQSTIEKLVISEAQGGSAEFELDEALLAGAFFEDAITEDDLDTDDALER